LDNTSKNMSLHHTKNADDIEYLVCECEKNNKRHLIEDTHHAIVFCGCCGLVLLEQGVIQTSYGEQLE